MSEPDSQKTGSDKTTWLWVGGVFLILGGIMSLTEFPAVFAAPLLFGAGAMLLPPVWRTIEMKIPAVSSYSTLYRAVACVMALFVLGVLIPKDSASTTSSSSTVPAVPQRQAALAPSMSDDGAIGVWRAKSPYEGLITIAQAGDTIVFVWRFRDGSNYRRTLRESREGRQRRFDPTESGASGDYYLVAEDGYLEIWDSQGLVTRAEPVG